MSGPSPKVVIKSMPANAPRWLNIAVIGLQLPVVETDNAVIAYTLHQGQPLLAKVTIW